LLEKFASFVASCFAAAFCPNGVLKYAA
jgi:hypothetical protein